MFRRITSNKPAVRNFASLFESPRCGFQVSHEFYFAPAIQTRGFSFSSSVWAKTTPTPEPKDQSAQDDENLSVDAWDFPWEVMKPWADLDVIKKEKAIKPPQFIPRKTGKYAMELFEYASALGDLEKVRTQTKELQKTLQEGEHKDAVKDKYTSKVEASDILRPHMARLSRALQREIALIVEQGNFRLLFDVFNVYEELAKAHFQEVDVHISFAKPPSPSKLERVKAKVLLNLPPGARPLWHVTVKPELIDGYTLDAEVYSEDTTKLKDLQEEQNVKQELTAQRRAAIQAVERLNWPDWTDEELRTAKREHRLPSFGAKTHEEFLQLNKKFQEQKVAEERERFKRYFVDWA